MLKVNKHAYAALYLDDARVASIQWANKDVTTATQTVSLVVNQWHSFELLPAQRLSQFRNCKISVDLDCPGLETDTTMMFPLNTDDAMPRRRRQYQSWPTWPEYSSSSAVSNPVSLAAGSRIYLLLECAMGERKGAPCGVGARVLTAKAPVEASIGARQRRWRARVGGSADSQSPQRCHEIMDKAECCATIDQEGDVCVPAVTTFSNGAVCAGWTSFLKGSEEARTVAACPPQQDLATKSARSRVRLADGVSQLAERSHQVLLGGGWPFR